MKNNTINNKEIPTIEYGELDSEEARILNRIYNTLDTTEGELKIQWDGPLLLAKAANVEVSKAASVLNYLIDNGLAYYREDAPGLYLRYEALSDKLRRKYYN